MTRSFGMTELLGAHTNEAAATEEPTVRVAVVDDEGVHCAATAAVFIKTPWVASTLAVRHPNLLDLQAHPVDVVVLDLMLNMGAWDDLSIDWIPTIVRSGAKVVVYSASNRPAHVRDSFASGVHGYAHKQEGEEHLRRMVLDVHQGRTPDLGPISQAILESLLDLTDREIEVVTMKADGLSEKQIAAELYISVSNVGKVMGRVYSKLRALGVEVDRSKAPAVAKRFVDEQGLRRRRSGDRRTTGPNEAGASR